MSVDFWWPCVSTLLHMDGANNGTTFTDAAGNTVTVSGSVVTSTTSPKFGTASGYFPGGASDFLTVTPTWAPRFYFGSGNFTIEGWFKENAVSRLNMTMIEKDSGTFPAGSWVLLINADSASSGKVAFSAADYSTSAYALRSANTFNDNAWHHVAVVRNGDQWTLFVDGTAEDRLVSTATISDLSTDPVIGYSVHGSRAWTGYLDEWRITKGVARYTVNFTVQTAAFPETYDDGTYTGPAGPAGQNIVGPPGPPGDDGEGANLTPIALPPAPPQYDQADQAQARRIIEQGLRG